MSGWSEIKTVSIQESLPTPIVAGQVLQIAFLEGLYAQKEALDIAFHGGTSIRLIYGGYRYSEDLDFCVNPLHQDFTFLDALVAKAYEQAKNLITLYLGPAVTELKKKERKKIPTWWFHVLAPGEHQKYRVKIEFGLYPAYTKKPLPVKIKDPFLPRQPIVLSLSAEELLADKINALADRPYTKERDYFDLWYLRRVMGVEVDWALLAKKLKDYNSNDPKNRLQQRLKDLDATPLAANMNLFLPLSYRALLESTQYSEMVGVCRNTLEDVLMHLPTP